MRIRAAAWPASSLVLNVADDRYAARLAAPENGVNLDDRSPPNAPPPDTSTPLRHDASRRLAEQVQQEISGWVRSRIGDVEDLGVKAALFHVLVGALYARWCWWRTAFIRTVARKLRRLDP